VIPLDFGGRNVLILGAPRSGTHALASHLLSMQPFRYLGEIGRSQDSTEPWKDIEQCLVYEKIPVLAHLVQSRSKLGMIVRTREIKSRNFVLALRRRDKVKQFASWIYFRNMGAIYNFDHAGQDYMAPGSFTVTYDDIEQFVIDQIVDDQFDPDLYLYYEDTDFSQSKVQRNRYVFEPELMIQNLDLVRKHLQHWEYIK